MCQYINMNLLSNGHQKSHYTKKSMKYYRGNQKKKVLNGYNTVTTFTYNNSSHSKQIWLLIRYVTSKSILLNELLSFCLLFLILIYIYYELSLSFLHLSAASIEYIPLNEKLLIVIQEFCSSFISQSALLWIMAFHQTSWYLEQLEHLCSEIPPPPHDYPY